MKGSDWLVLCCVGLLMALADLAQPPQSLSPCGPGSIDFAQFYPLVYAVSGNAPVPYMPLCVNFPVSHPVEEIFYVRPGVDPRTSLMYIPLAKTPDKDHQIVITYWTKDQ